MTSPLKRIRLQNKRTLQEVADATGTDTGNLSRIERGKQVPSKDLAEKLVNYFDRKISEIQIIYPERFVVPEEASSAPYAGPERRKGGEAHHVIPERRTRVA